MGIRSFGRAARIGLAAAFLAAAAAHAQIRVEPEVQLQSAASATARVALAKAARIPNVALEAPGAEEVARALDAPRKTGVPLQVGFARPVPALADEARTSTRLAWDVAGDREWAAGVSITSPGASALRMGLRIASLPAGAVLRFSGPEDATVHEVSAEEALAAIERNLRAAEQGADARTFWSPVVESSTIVFEVVVPPDADPREVRFSSPTISHLVASARNNFAMAKASAECEIDAVCHPAWSTESDAVARIIYTRDGSSFACSGTLLADRDTSSAIPYFLTANHCISTQASASSIQSYWFYRSTGCDSGARGAYRTLTGGAELLYGSQSTDTALVRLHGTPPAGAVYAGWIVGAPLGIGSPVTGLHHPGGDLLKVSFGSVTGHYSCAPTDDKNFTCSRSFSPSTFYAVTWRAGITEAGSSGSGLFTDDGHYLVGQLYGGSTSCSDPEFDFYGRFDVAYNSGLSRWLGATAGSAPSATPTHNYGDLWWNPYESGWGLSITQHGSTIFAGWYIYDDAGRPTWIVMPGGRWTSPTSYTGDLYATSGPGALGAFDPRGVTRTRVGIGTLDFISASRGTFSYDVNGIGGRKQIERQVFGSGPAPGTHYGDLWWNANESGWGISITQQGSSLFAVWYVYDADGRPTWYVLPSGSWTSGDTYSGTLYRTATAPLPFLYGLFSASSVSRIPVGSLTLRFTGANSATMSYNVEGATGSKSITRQPF